MCRVTNRAYRVVVREAESSYAAGEDRVAQHASNVLHAARRQLAPCKTQLLHHAATSIQTYADGPDPPTFSSPKAPVLSQSLRELPDFLLCQSNTAKLHYRRCRLVLPQSSRYLRSSRSGLTHRRVYRWQPRQLFTRKSKDIHTTGI